MRLNAEVLKKSLAAKGHKWFEGIPNLIGVRTTLNLPNQYNDVLAIITDPNPIDPTGVQKFYRITTDPGETYLKKPLNPKGCAVLMPGQYINCWGIGFHKQNPDHPALVQIGNVTVYRDNDRDPLPEEGGPTYTGLFGINCHGATKGMESKLVGGWSAGCQVFANYMHKDEAINYLKKYQALTQNKFSYTLLREADLIF